jgi:hypothetical protein
MSRNKSFHILYIEYFFDICKKKSDLFNNSSWILV